MARKLMISEGFKDGEPEAVMTVRAPKIIYGLITEDAEAQGISISTLLRDVLGLYYLPEHLKTKLKEGSSLTAIDVTMLEGLRAHTQDLSKQLGEIDALRGQASDTQKPDENLKRLVEEAVEQALASKLVGFEKAWNSITSRTRKQGKN